MIVVPLTFDPKRFLKLSEVAVQCRGGVAEWRKLSSLQFHGEYLIIGLEQCETPEEARRYRGALLKIRPSESPPLPEGVYYHYQIIGLKVYTVAGDYIGEIRSILETGSNDVYVVRGEEGEQLVPALKNVIKEIDIDSKRMVIRPMETEG